MKHHCLPIRRAFAGLRGVFAALLVSSVLLAPKASAYVEYKGWDSTGFFHMILDVSQDPKTNVVIINGGRIEFKSLANPYPVQQAQGAKVPKLQANQMAGVVVFAQANIGATATLFTGNLVGPLAGGTLYARDVRFEAYNKVFDINFTMTPGGAPVAAPPPAPAPAPVAPKTLINVGGKLTVVTPTPTPTPAPSPAAVTRVYLDSSNTGGVTQNASPKLPSLITYSPLHVTQIWTYHWNNGRGATPGTIALKGFNGTTYGPWPASASSGSNNAPNVNWTVNVNVTIPAGTYQVVDSSPSTWSQNAESRGVGFAKLYAHP